MAEHRPYKTAVAGSIPAERTSNEFARSEFKYRDMRIRTLKGFTLIELMVVISVISLLSSVVLTSLNSARLKARYAKSRVELDQFIKAAVIAQGEGAKRLQDITGSGCSDCPCRGQDIRNIPTNDPCFTSWVNVLTTIQNATAGTVSGIDRMTRDPWGSPYNLDENEKESGPTDCRLDTVRSVGPNGIREDESCTGAWDDLCFVIPHSSPCP